MKDNQQTKVKEIVKNANSYAQTKESSSMKEIEDAIGTLFKSQTVKFWKIDSKNNTIAPLEGETDASVPLKSSLTKQAIESKKILLENHVTSDKYYNSEIDNPFALKIKALIIYPILQGKMVVGVLKIWRGVKQRKVFSKKDEALLLSLSPLWLHIFEGTEVAKETLLAMLGDTVEKNTSKPKVNKEVSAQKTVTKPMEHTNEVQRELEALKKERDTLAEENQRYKENEKEQENYLKTYESKMTELEATYTQELEAAKVKYKELETSSLELYTESQLNQVMIKELEKELKLVKKENKSLLSEVKEKKRRSKSIKELKSEKSLLLQQKTKNVFDNIEACLVHVDKRFAENEYAYILFEMMLYALNSKKGMAYIEENLQKTKVISHIIDGYYFQGDIEVYNEKCHISDLVEHTKSYEKDIFSNMIHIDIDVEKNMPTSLVFDVAKIQSIILHLLIDLHQFVDQNNPVNVKFTFKKKFLNIELGGSIYKKNSLFQSMFKQTKLGADEKDRRGLHLSKKLISRLKGEINHFYENNYYKFIVSIPTQLIKI